MLYGSFAALLLATAALLPCEAFRLPVQMASGRVGVLCQDGGLGVLAARRLAARDGVKPVVVLHTGEGAQAPAAVDGCDVYYGDVFDGSMAASGGGSRKNAADALRGCDSVLLAMDDGLAGVDRDVDEAKLVQSALAIVKDADARNVICVVPNLISFEDVTGVDRLRLPPTPEAAVRRFADGAASASQVTCVYHGDLCGSSTSEAFPFEGPPLVTPSVNPAASLGQLQLSASRSPALVPVKGLPETRDTFWTARSHAAAVAERLVLREGAGGAAFEEVTAISVLGPAADPLEIDGAMEKLASGAELLELEVYADEAALRKYVKGIYKNQALRNVELFAKSGARPVGVRETESGLEVRWETLTEDLNAVPAGSVDIVVSGGGKGRITCTRKSVEGGPLRSSLPGDDDLMRGLVEAMNKRFPKPSEEAPPAPAPEQPAAAAPAAPAAPEEPEASEEDEDEDAKPNITPSGRRRRE